jgi:SpoIID/LytB domain protein
MRLVRTRLAAVAVTAAALTVPLLAQAAPAEAFTVPSTANYIPVSTKGNGHGHGMSQYGAYGAALAGKTYQQILAFYYPGTTLTTVGWSPIRVLVSNTGTTLQVRAEYGLTVTKVGKLPYTGISWYRLLADAGSTETLQAYKTATKAWSTVATGLPEASAFTRGWTNLTQLRLSNGTMTRYYGYLRAIRRSLSGTSGGVGVVNMVTLDMYAQGVAPREMPASWSAAAVKAQAVAARTYGRYAVEHASDPDYDICDTSSCQVYGGAIHYNADGSVAYRDDPAAISGNSNQVLKYQGATIFSQFSASNGGWSVAGGRPYLVAKQDPYDPAQGNDPYTLVTKKMKLSTLAAKFGLTVLTTIAISSRDGNGDWGGRVRAGYVIGRDSSGTTRKVSFDGPGLQADVGAGTTWITFGAPTTT